MSMRKYKIKPSPSLYKLAKLKMKLKKKKPVFIRMNSWIKNSLSFSWRKPKGIDNKIRLEKKGFPLKVKCGYRSPKKIRGLHPSGFREIIVYRVEEIENIDSSQYAIKIASTVGKRKKYLIYERAKELGIKVLNPPEIV